MLKSHFVRQTSHVLFDRSCSDDKLEQDDDFEDQGILLFMTGWLIGSNRARPAVRELPRRNPPDWRNPACALSLICAANSI
jgi:hypothetical protein